MSDPEPPPEPQVSQTVIGLRTALILFAILAVIACFILKGYALGLGLIIIGGAALKAYIHHLRGHLED